MSANSWPNIDERYWFMDIRFRCSSGRSAWCRLFLATGSLVVFMATAVMRVEAQQLVPFGDVPATENFSEAEIATRGRQPDRPLTYAPWRKVCFKATQETGSKMVCRTTINGRWGTGQIALRADLIERERRVLYEPHGGGLRHQRHCHRVLLKPLRARGSGARSGRWTRRVAMSWMLVI